jgi:hypothetical protein
MAALEPIPALPVPLLTVAALRTGAGRVPRIDRDHRDAGQRRLVGDEGAKLRERPAVVAAPLGLGSRGPLADESIEVGANRECIFSERGKGDIINKQMLFLPR